MNKHVRIITQEARALGREVGVSVDIDTRRGAGHPVIVLTGPHGKRRLSLPSSPSDRDFVIRNVRAPIRKLIREVS